MRERVSEPSRNKTTSSVLTSWAFVVSSFNVLQLNRLTMITVKRAYKTFTGD